jgi:hypothetical protein
MDACRYEIGKKSAEIIASTPSNSHTTVNRIIELEPNFNRGETVRPLDTD